MHLVDPQVELVFGRLLRLNRRNLTFDRRQLAEARVTVHTLKYLVLLLELRNLVCGIKCQNYSFFPGKATAEQFALLFLVLLDLYGCLDRRLLFVLLLLFTWLRRLLPLLVDLLFDLDSVRD